MGFCQLYVEGVVDKPLYGSVGLWTVMLHKLFVAEASYCSSSVEIGVVVLGLYIDVSLPVVVGPQ
jgi:hypothetical protein